MKYHPILFSTPMVQGIDENRKKQTRRTKGLELFNENPERWRYDGISEIDGGHYMELITVSGEPTENYFESKCPYNIGDVLWVRETFVREYTVDANDQEQFSYKADSDSETTIKLFGGKWKPSLFMPKAACRTFLKIKSIRAERLQDISEADAIAEGVESKNNQWRDYFNNNTEPSFGMRTAARSFKTLWYKLNGVDSYLQNPFVWVYEFEKIAKPEDFI